MALIHSFDGARLYMVGEYEVLSGFCTSCNKIHSSISQLVDGDVFKIDFLSLPATERDIIKNVENSIPKKEN